MILHELLILGTKCYHAVNHYLSLPMENFFQTLLEIESCAFIFMTHLSPIQLLAFVL